MTRQGDAAVHQRPSTVECPCTGRLLSAATDAIGAYHFNDNLYQLAALRRARLSAPLQWRVQSTRVHGNLPLRHETSRTPSPTTHGRQPWQVLRFPLAPCLSILSDTKIGPAHLGEPVRLLWQYRIIQQEHSARDFLPIQGLKSAGILCVPARGMPHP